MNRAGKQQGNIKGAKGALARGSEGSMQALLGLPDLTGLSNNLTEKMKFEQS